MQVRDTLGMLTGRFEALKIDGGSMFLGRLNSRNCRKLTLKRIVQYSPNWVRNQVLPF